MFYFGVVLMIWLAAGFVFSLKGVYLDKVPEGIANLSEEEIDQVKGSNDKANEITMKLLTNKGSFIAIMTLFGFVTVWLDMKNAFKKE